MWKDAADDESNTAWHQECVRLMKPYITGYYIGEADPVAVPSEATGAFSPESWKRLADLRDKYDPEGVFFGYFDDLVYFARKNRTCSANSCVVQFRTRHLSKLKTGGGLPTPPGERQLCGNAEERVKIALLVAILIRITKQLS